MASTTPQSPATSQVLDSEADKNEKELSTPPSSDIEPKPNLVSESALTVVPAAEELEWVSGVKLLSIVTGVTLVCFLMLLDTSIVVTVRTKNSYSMFPTKNYQRQFLVSRAIFTLCLMWVGMAVLTNSQGMLVVLICSE